MNVLAASSGVDWTTVIVAAISAISSLLAAIFAGAIHRQIKTPSGTSLGAQVEQAHVTAILNNKMLSAQTTGAHAVEPTEAAGVLAEKPKGV